MKWRVLVILILLLKKLFLVVLSMQLHAPHLDRFVTICVRVERRLTSITLSIQRRIAQELFFCKLPHLSLHYVIRRHNFLFATFFQWFTFYSSFFVFRVFYGIFREVTIVFFEILMLLIFGVICDFVDAICFKSVVLITVLKVVRAIIL